MSIERHIYPISGMACAACSASVESMLNHTPGVREAGVNLANGTAWVVFDTELTSPQQLQAVVQSIGFGMDIEAEYDIRRNLQAKRNEALVMRRRMVLAFIGAATVMLLQMYCPDRLLQMLLIVPISFITVYIFGRSFHLHALRQLRHRQVSMDTLVALSSGVAYTYSLIVLFERETGNIAFSGLPLYFDSAAMVVAFILIGKWLEARAKARTSGAIEQLMGLQPDVAHLVDGEDTHDIPLAEVLTGMRLRILPGERMPVDGRVVSGESYLDESSITGEPLAQRKTTGDAVYAGTLNGKGSLTIETESVGVDSVLGRIIQQVEEAQGSKVPIQQLADTVAGYFVPVVLGIALLTLLAWGYWGGRGGWMLGFHNAITVLAIACPCALGLATPTAIMVAVGRAAREHILVRDAQGLQMAGELQELYLDKTGTLTQGTPAVVGATWRPDGMGELEGKRVLHSLELQSEHPLASAVLAWAQDAKPYPVDDAQSLPGEGLSATINGLGYSVLRCAGQNPEWAMPFIAQAEAQGHTISSLYRNGELECVFALTDSLKPTSREALERIHALGITTHILSGDRQSVVKPLAHQLGVDTAEGGMLPDQKAERIAAAVDSGLSVGMVGDGINDSPALARATVSFAMGRGADVALGVSTFTLASDDLSRIAWVVSLSRITMRIVRENLLWAFLYNLVAIPVATGILYRFWGILRLDPMFGALAMALSSVIVVTNSLRINRIRIHN
ncbi:MAG: copper-translocating P-type ATPase [Bacteroidetes bacterium]|nr:MAG: copper-translocating P-type ATPase [Bacteroidota bacterium]